jgi:hypothetical protein
MKIAEIVATALTLASVFLVTQGFQDWGFLLGILGNLAWITWAIGIKGIGIIAVNTIMCVLYLSGFIQLLGV